MKKKKLLFLLLYLLFSIQGFAQKQEPQFIMPLIFIDANNDSDTLWLGYDPEASIYPDVLDTAFGETIQWIDTTQFHTYWYWAYNGSIGTGGYYPLPTDSVGKTAILGSGIYSPGDVGFVNGVMPITIKWVDSLLNSPNLPAYYPDTIAPRPRARIDIYNGGLQPSPCPIEMPYVLSGYLKPFIEDGFCGLGCCADDSLYLDGLPGWTPGVMGLNVFVAPHNADIIGDGVDEYSQSESIEIFPNPFEEKLIIKSKENGKVDIYNSLGG